MYRNAHGLATERELLGLRSGLGIRHQRFQLLHRQVDGRNENWLRIQRKKSGLIKIILPNRLSADG